MTAVHVVGLFAVGALIWAVAVLIAVLVPVRRPAQDDSTGDITARPDGRHASNAGANWRPAHTRRAAKNRGRHHDANRQVNE